MTDVSNANRTMLMSLETVAWDDRLCSFFGVPKEILPIIASSAEVYGYFAGGPLKGVPICGVSVAQTLTFSGSAVVTVIVTVFFVFVTMSGSASHNM